MYSDAEVRAWRAMYEDGATVLDISLETGAATNTVRSRLAAIGTPMRAQGGQLGHAKNRAGRAVDGIEGKQAPPVRRPAVAFRRARRRSRW